MSVLQRLATAAAVCAFAGASIGGHREAAAGAAPPDNRILVTEATFRAPDVTTAHDQAVIPVRYQGEIPLGVAVVTLEYNGAVCRLESVEPGTNAPTWAVAAINDNQYGSPNCAAAEPLRRATVVLLGDVWCSDQLADGELVRFVFRRQGPGGATPLNFIDACDSQWMNQGSDCLGAFLVVPRGIPGSVDFAQTVDAAKPTWARVKDLYR